MSTANDGTVQLDLNPQGVNDTSIPGVVDISRDVQESPIAPAPPQAAPKQIQGQVTPKKVNLPAEKPPIVSPTPTVPMFSPTGDIGDVPAGKVHDAISAGAVIGSPIIAPDGTRGVVPASRLHEALKAGAKIDDTGWSPEIEAQNHPSLAQRAVNTVAGPGTIGADVLSRWQAASPKGDLNAPYQSTGQLGQPSVITPPEAHEELSKGVVANAMTPEERQQHPFLAAGLDFAGGFSSPENLAIMIGSGGLGKLPGPAGQIIGKALSSGFGVMAIYTAAKESPQFMDALARGDEPGAKEALMKVVLNIAAGEQAAEHVTDLKPNLGTTGQAAEAGAQALGAAGTEYGNKAADVLKTTGRGAGVVASAAGDLAAGGAKMGAGIITQPVKAMLEAPEERIRRAAGGSAGVQERDFTENVKRTLPYLVEQNKIGKIVTPEDMAEAAHEQKVKLWDEKLGGKHPGETIDGDKIADQIIGSINESTARHFPEVGDAIKKWADTFRGPYNLDAAMQAITDFNSKLRNFYKQSPSEQFRMAAADPKLGMLQDAVDALRETAFDKLQQLGEKNIPELRKDYGALNQLQRVFEKRAVVYGRQAPIDFKQSMGAVAAAATGHIGAAAVPLITKYINSPEHLIKSAIKKAGKAPAAETAETPETPTEPAETPVNPTKATAASGLGSKIDLETRQLRPVNEKPPTEPVAETTGQSVEKPAFVPFDPKNPVGYEPAMTIPRNVIPNGMFPRDVLGHEWGHITNAAIENIHTEGIKSHLSPDMQNRGSAAAAIINLAKSPGFEFKNGLMTPDTLTRNSGRLLSVMMGGAAANEIHGGIPFEINEGLRSDLKKVKGVLKSLGLTPDEVERGVQYGLDRARRNLTIPKVGGKLLENSTARETGLSPDMHASPERTESYADEIRRLRDEHRQTANEITGDDNPRNDRQVRGVSQSDDAGTKGESPAGSTPGNLAGGASLETSRPSGLQNGLREKSTGDDKVDQILKSQGAIPAGKMENLALFHDPETGSTLALKAQDVTPELVEKHLQQSRESFGVKSVENTTVPKISDWEPPKGINEGISRNDAVKTQIPLSKISLGERSYNAAASDISRGRGSKTEGPVSIVYNPDNGQYLVEDGVHRIVQAHQEGKETIPAKIWSGYSDVANVRPENKMDLTAEETDVPEIAPESKALLAYSTDHIDIVDGTGKILKTYKNTPLGKEIAERDLPRWQNQLASPKSEEVVEQTANQAAKQARRGGFVADFRTGKPTDTGFLVEILPEERSLLDHDVTPRDIKLFYNEHRKLFQEHPELRIGGYKNELNISAHTDDPETAKNLAEKLDQRSVWDVKKGEEIPTGGQGRVTHFTGYPFEDRIKDLRNQ